MSPTQNLAAMAGRPKAKLNERQLWQLIQRTVGARPDGDPGILTAKAIVEKFGIELPEVDLVEAQTGRWPRDVRAEMEAFYGLPGEGHTMLDVPYPLYVEGKRVDRINVHSRIAEAVHRALTNTLEHYGAKQVKALGLDIYDGCYNNRPKRGGTSLSVHAYAAALDFNAEHNALRMDHAEALFAGPEYEPWWRFWEAEGAVSLGRARDYDWMHVQFARLA